MEKALKLVPFYSLLLLFTNYYSIAFYYEHFGIDINNYLDLSELLLISLPIFKNLSTALFIVFLVFSPAVVIGVIKIVVSPYTKKATQIISEKMAPVQADKPNPSQESVLIKVKSELGFHLTEEIIELLNKEYRYSKTRKQLVLKVLNLLFITVVIIGFIMSASNHMYSIVMSIKAGSIDFYGSPSINIFFLIITPVAVVYMFCQLFSASLIWAVLFKPLYKFHNLPTLIIILSFIASLLYNYADVLRIKENKETSYYKVYLKQMPVLTDISGYRFVGRTKQYLFLTNGSFTKTININDADSIIVKSNNKTR